MLAVLRDRSIGTRIWLGLTVLIIGYAASLGYSFIQGQQAEHQLDAISVGVFPAAQVADHARNDFKLQLDAYQEAVVQGDEEALAAAAMRAQDVKASLQQLLELPQSPADLLNEARQLLAAHQGFSDSAATMYLPIAKGQEPESLDEIAALSQQGKKLSERLVSLSETAAAVLHEQLADLQADSALQRQLGLVVFVVTLLTVVIVMTLTIKYWIQRPIRQTMTMIRDMGSDYIDVETKTNDELKIFQASFTAMTARIKDHITALEGEVEERQRAQREVEELNNNLEQRVADRTSELSRAMDELQQAQQQLVEAEKMSSLGGMVAGIAHEINTPIGIGVTASSHLQDEINKVTNLFESGSMKKGHFRQFLGKVGEGTSLVLANLERAANLVQSFKKVSVDQSSDAKRVFNLKDYIDDVVLSLRPNYKNTGHTVEVTGLQSVTVNNYPGPLAQVVTNLVDNSLVHAFAAGDAGHIRLHCSKQDDLAVVEYSDDGQGMATEVLEKVFEPFFTTKRGSGGSGLGMHLVYNLVSGKLKGTVECESSPGNGMRVRIVFPINIEDGQRTKKVGTEVKHAQA